MSENEHKFTISRIKKKKGNIEICYPIKKQEKRILFQHPFPYRLSWHFDIWYSWEYLKGYYHIKFIMLKDYYSL